MRLHKLSFIILIFIASFQICFGQEKPQAKLIDEFDNENCDSLSLKFDNLMVQLVNDLNAVGYVVIYGDKNEPLAKYFQEALFKEYIRFRKFDDKRIKFLHGEDEEGLRNQFWKSSDVFSKPYVKEIDWKYGLPPNMKPLKVHKDSWISEVCPEVFNIEFYSKFLLANPNFRGNLVIFESTANKFDKTKKKLLRELAKNYKVSSNQLSFFYVKGRKSDVEYWLVPKKKFN